MTVTQPVVRRHALTVPRFSFGTEMAGLLIALLGAWSGIVPFVGPTFGFSADGSGSWYWNLSHALLFLAPGAAALVGGILIVLGRRGAQAAGGLLAAVAGAWLVVGALVWPIFYGTFFVGASPIREFAYWIGYSLGPGGLLIGLGAFTLGRTAPPAVVREQYAADPALRERPVGERPVVDRPATEPGPTAGPVGNERRIAS